MKCFELASMVLCAAIVCSTANYQPAPSASAQPSQPSQPSVSNANYYGSRFPSYTCVDLFNPSACEGLPDGDYPLCTLCEYGYYATCSNGDMYIRPCAESYYYGNQIVARMVFHAYTRDCQRYAPNCPRY